MEKYLQYVINTSASGCIEVDDYGRTNLIFAMGETTGYTFIGGELSRPDDAIRLACPLNENRMHAFTTSGSVIPRFCQRCGEPIVS